MKKKFVYQNYILRCLIEAALVLALVVFGVIMFLKIWMRLSGAEVIGIEMFALQVDKVKNALYVGGVGLYAIFVAAFKRLIYPELTSKTKLFVKTGYYETESGELRIRTAFKEYSFTDIELLMITSAREYIRQYGYARIDTAASPVRYMMDGKMTIKGSGGKCTLYFFLDKPPEDATPPFEMIEDILQSFDGLELTSETDKETVYER